MTTKEDRILSINLPTGKLRNGDTRTEAEMGGKG